MKTIVQVVQRLSPGGIEVMALEMLRLHEQNVKAYIVSLEGNKKAMLTQWPRLEPFSKQLIFLGKPPGWHLATIYRLTKVFKQLNANAIHTHHIGPLIYGGAAARLAGVKRWIHTEHDAWHLENSKRRFLEKTAVFLLRPKIVADSRPVADALASSMGLKNIKVIGNGIDTKTFKPGNMKHARNHLRLPLNAKIIGCAGRMEPEKGQTVLLDAMRYLPPEIHLALAGTGSEFQALKNQSVNLGIRNRVHFLGHVDDMKTFYQALNVFCLSSFKEGMPLAPLEAQACGVAAVLPKIGACKDSLCPKTGALVIPGAPVALAMTLVRILERNNTETPRDFVCKNANAQTMTHAYTELCLNLKGGAIS